MKIFIFFFLILTSSLVSATTEIHLYWVSSCPHCHEQIKDVNRLQRLYPDLKVSTYQLDNKKYVEKLLKISEFYQIQFGSVPVSFVGDQAWIGFDQRISIEIEKRINECFSRNLDCQVKTGVQGSRKDFIIKVPLVGDIDLQKNSLVISTIMIGLIDGFNPCSLWVLSLLMTMIVGTISRKRILIIGISFLLTTAIIYAIFMAGIVSSLQYLNKLTWIKIAVALLTLTFALVNIKDYFWYKRGLSFTIPKQFQPDIYRRLRQIAHSKESTLILIGFTVLIAGGIAIVEFPCTAGFPIIWGQLILQSSVVGTQYFSLLMLYIIAYLMDELLIFLIIVATLNVTQMQEKHGRFLKLVSGMIMLGMSIALVFAPSIMEKVWTSFTFLLLAAAVSLLIHKIYKRHL
jgi:cytochrome c biogenesis protein CcdA/glutaredoxin